VPPDLCDSLFAQLTRAPAAARSGFGQLWRAASEGGDADTALDAVCGALLAINVDFVDFRGATSWCGRLASAWTQAVAESSIEAAARGELRGLRRCAGALVWPSLDPHGSGDPARFAAAAAGLAKGLRAAPELPPDERFSFAKSLLDYYGQQMNPQAASSLLALELEVLALRPASPEVQARWWFIVMAHHGYFGETAGAAHARQRLQALIDRHDLVEARCALLVIDIPELLQSGRLEAAVRAHDEIESLLPRVPAGFHTHCLRAQAMVLAWRGELSAALGRLDRLLALCGDLEVPERDQGAYRVQRADLLVALQRHPEALMELATVDRSQVGTQRQVLGVIQAFALAADALQRQDPQALGPALETAFQGAARYRFQRFYLALPPLAARLCHEALQRSIESEFVRHTVRLRQLPAPDPSRDDWPWRLRVRAFGALQVERDDVLLRWSGKSPRKPLELLAMLAAQGGGPVDMDQLLVCLWPTGDAMAPKASLEMALARLRKLLGLPEALRVRDDAISLDDRLVWCDTVAFEAGVARLPAVLADEPQRAEATWLLKLYRQPLLGSEALDGRMRLARERLALAHQRLVRLLGQHFEGAGDWNQALDLYTTALSRDVLSEPIHRALIRVHLARGESAEAIRCFRRCQELLASVLGVAPNEQTRELYEQARRRI